MEPQLHFMNVVVYKPSTGVQLFPYGRAGGIPQ